MGQKDEENPVSEEDVEPEREKLRPNPPQEMEMTKIPIKTNDAGYPEMIAGNVDPLIKSHHLKYMLFGFNLFISLLGIALLTITIWIRVDSEFWEYETTLRVDNFYTICAMLIVASLVVITVGFLGCIGATTERRWMLIMYMVLFGIVFLIELAALVLMWSAPYSKTISTQIDKRIKDQIAARQADDSSRYFIDFIQENLYCCGASGVGDYIELEAPKSCQNPRTGDVYQSGCTTKLLTYLRAKAGIVGGVALPILFVQLLALLAAGCLIKSLEVESRYLM